MINYSFEFPPRKIERIFTVIAPVAVEGLWLELAPWIAQSVDQNNASEELESIKQACLNGNMQLMVIGKPPEIEMVLVTHTFSYAGRKTICITNAAGKMPDTWYELLALLENYALNQGFERIQVQGRSGWVRKLKSEGYALDHVCLSKSLLRGLH